MDQALCTHPQVYWCPASGENECPTCGGFETCCDRPELHEPPIPARSSRWPWWTSPGYWRAAVVHLAYRVGLRGYCPTHDQLRWAWTHRSCCSRNRQLVTRLARRIWGT